MAIQVLQRRVDWYIEADSRRSLLSLFDDGGSQLLWNVGISLPISTASCFRRRDPPWASLWERQISRDV